MAARVEEVPEETPRRARASAWLLGSRSGLPVLGLGWLVLAGAVAFVMSAVPTAWDDVLVTLRGRSTQGRALAVLPTDATLRSRPVSEIVFTFGERGGRARTARCRTADPALLVQARLGAALPVRYDPVHPSRARIRGTRLSPFGAFAFAPLLLALAGLVSLALWLARGVALRRLLVHGTRAAGRVVSASVSESPFRRARPYDVLYAFEGPGGELQAISDESEALRAATEVAVLYDPRRPWRSTLPAAGAFERSAR